MSHPPVPGPPNFDAPQNYQPYGGDLQSYGRPPSPAAPPWTPPPAAQPIPTAQPAPAYYYPSASVSDGPPARPAVVGMAATMSVTASLQWIAALSLAWLLANAGIQQLNISGADGGIYHILASFNFRMLDGLAWPLYLFPVASAVSGLVVLARRRWARIAFTVVGVAALGWSAWFLRDDLLWWLPPGAYIAVAVGIVWVPAANRWYGWMPSSHRDI